MSVGDASLVSEQLGESLMGTAQIVFFLMGAMTIVEVVDAHNGFDVITTRIRTTQLSTLMWLVGFVTFFLSAILDNVPLVAAAMGMYSLTQYPSVFFWEFLAYCAGTGGLSRGCRGVPRAAPVSSLRSAKSTRDQA